MNSLNIRDLAYIAVFAALTIALGAIVIPVGTAGVPIVLQNLGIFLAAFLLGSIRGGLSITLFVGVGLIGVPNLSGWKPTIAAISGPTVGYIVGYVIAAFIIGAIAQWCVRRFSRNRSAALTVGFIIAGIVGTAIMYLSGTFGLMIRLGLDFPAALGTNLPFIPGDLAKVIVAALIAVAVHRAMPNLLPSSRPKNTTSQPLQS